MTPEELFNHCLSVLESPDSVEQPTFLTFTRSPQAIPNYIFHLTNRPEDALLFAQICFNCNRFDVIKVMKSGIFHKGGLKGRPLSMNNQDYVVYYFKDLVATILRATSYLINEKPGEHLRYYISAFDRAINQIDRLKSIASSYHSKRNWDKLFKIKKGLEDIKSDLLERPDIALPPRFKDKEDCVDSLLCLFMSQLPPDTPDSVIYNAIFALLQLFSIFFIGVAGIRQRITRAKRK